MTPFLESLSVGVFHFRKRCNFMNTIDIAKDFTRYPAGRNRKDGPFSGQAFRENLLVPALSDNRPIRLMMDGTRGYGSSFLEEAFGGLVRAGFDPNMIKDLIEINSNDPSLIHEIHDYLGVG